METTAKPVVLLAGHDQEYTTKLRAACEKEGNQVFETPDFASVLTEVYAEKNRRVMILASIAFPGITALLAYVQMAVEHRVIVVIIEKGVDSDPENTVRKWTMGPRYRVYQVYDKLRVYLPGLAYWINATPAWDDKKKVLTDPLTGLDNLQGFVKNVKPELEAMRDRRQLQGGRGDRRKPHMENVALLIIDANRLKRINDVWGHLEGDEAIVAISNALRKLIRSGHYICRKSGDEWLILLPGFTYEQAVRRGEQFVSAIANSGFTDPNGEPWPLSAFFGAASRHASEISADVDETVKELIADADTPLRKLKKGRNKAEGKLPGER